MAFYTLDTVVEATGVDLSQSIDFTVYAAGGSTISKIAVAVKYVDDPRRFMVYETDGFVTPFAPDSSVAGEGSSVVTFTVFEFGGWRQRLREIYVFGVQADGDTFCQDVLNLPPVSAVENIGITIDGLDAGNSGSDADLNLVIPFGTEVGDLMVMNGQSGNTPPLPAGWTNIGNYTRSHFGGGTAFRACYKVVNQTDLDAGVIVWDQGFRTGAFCGCLGVYRNVNPVTPLQAEVLLGTNAGDPEIECPGAGCHTAAVSGSGSPYNFWGPGFLTPFANDDPGAMFVYMMGGGSGGGGNPAAPSEHDEAYTAGGVLVPGASLDAWNSIGQSSTIRTRTSGQGCYSTGAPQVGYRWTGGNNNSNQTLGCSIILQPGVG